MIRVIYTEEPGFPAADNHPDAQRVEINGLFVEFVGDAPTEQEVTNFLHPAPIYSCTPWQIRKALNALGLRDAVEAAITESNDRMLKDGWEFANEFRSDDIFVLAMGASLGKDAAQTAEMIQYASTL